MINQNQEIFNKFMDEFVKLDDNKKNNEIINKQKEILAYLMSFANENAIEYCFLRSREINDLEGSSSSNSDYLEAMMVYCENIEELIGTILNNVVNS